ncbi:MAG: YgaP-like transmembrane domain, partial [Actinomycetota bacterium]
FGQFMASTAGRITRGLVGIALIVVGFVLGGVGGWILAGIGLVLLLAGLFDFCVITGLFDNIWSGARSGLAGPAGERREPHSLKWTRRVRRSRQRHAQPLRR